MNTLKCSLALGLSALAMLILTGCASTATTIDPADRDTTGAYDGSWTAAVSGPKSAKALLPGNARLTCKWDPFNVSLNVADGMIELAGIEGKTPVSTDGDFIIDFIVGSPTLRGGVTTGAEKSGRIIRGNLAGENPTGSYLTYISTFGRVGCQGDVTLAKR